MADLIERLDVPTLTTREDAAASLKRIAVAGAAEHYWTRAKDASQLFEAIKVKLGNQVAYVVWRQDVKVPSQVTGGPGRGKKGIAAQRSVLPDADPGKDIVERWRKALCIKQHNRWTEDRGKTQQALEDAHHRCVRVVEQENVNTIRGTEGTGEFERYTPAEYIEAVRAVLGTIELDPASTALAQGTVNAEQFFDAEDNGLIHDWHGRVFLNPPYHRELAPLFIRKLLDEITAEHTTEAVLLTNNSTDTEWFQTAADACECICFPAGRIKFTVPHRDPVLPTQGQAFFYFGNRAAHFVDVFAEIGFCMKPYHA